MTRPPHMSDGYFIKLAVNSLFPEGKGKFGISGGTYSGVTWIEEVAGVKPTQEEVDAKVAELKSAWDNDYKRLRKAEYPGIEELVVALYDTDDKAAIDEKRAEIKLKYPKPGA